MDSEDSATVMAMADMDGRVLYGLLWRDSKVNIADFDVEGWFSSLFSPFYLQLMSVDHSTIR